MTDFSQTRVDSSIFIPDSKRAWARLCVAVIIGSIGSVGMWSVVVALPVVQAEFSASRGAASLAFTFDKQGRISLTDELRRHAGIDKDAVLVGSLNKFSIYSPSRWEKVEQRTSGENFGDLMRRIGI